MNKSIPSHLIIFVILIFSSFYPAAGHCLSTDEAIKKIQETYDKAADYSAEFYQENTMGSIKRLQKAMGVVYFKKKGKMYWEYKEPMQQKVISNGSMMWIYQPDMNQVQQFDYDSLGMSRTALSFLNGIGSISDDFKVSPEDDGIKGNLVFNLIPKEENAGFVDMKMHINSDTYNIVKIVTKDAYGNTNSIAFRNIRFDTGVTDDFFEFKAPDGVIVVTPPAYQQK